jgi:hypothetical protein
MPTNSVHLDEHLKRTFGATGFTNSGANVTVTGTLTEAQLENLIETSRLTAYKATVVAGVLTLSPR